MSSRRFGLSFALLACALLGLYAYPYSPGFALGLLDGYLRAYAALAGAVLHVLDPAVQVSGVRIVGTRVSLTIVRGCDAAEVLLLASAAILAWPGPTWSRRLLAVAAVGAVGTAVNLVRIGSIYYVLLYAPAAADVVHFEVWPLAFVGLAAGAFRFWMRRASAMRAPAPAV